MTRPRTTSARTTTRSAPGLSSSTGGPSRRRQRRDRSLSRILSGDPREEEVRNMKRKTERLMTPRFGEIVYSQDDVYRFEKGLAGFPDLKRFVMLALDDTGIFRCLQSLDKTALAFVVV